MKMNTHKKKVNFFGFLLALFLLHVSVIAANKKIPAAITGTMNMGFGIIRIRLKPKSIISTSSNLTVLFRGKKVGILSGIYREENHLVGFFKPIGNFKIQKRMAVVLLIHKSNKPKPITLPVEIITESKYNIKDKGIIIQLQGGKDKGIKIGQHFSVKLCNKFPPIDYTVTRVFRKKSDLKFRAVEGDWLNQEQILKKLKSFNDYLAKNDTLPPDCSGPYFATQMKLQNMPRGFKLGKGGVVAVSSGKSATSSIPISLSGYKFVAETGYLRYLLSVKNIGKKVLHEIFIKCTFRWGVINHTLVARDSSIIATLEPGESKSVELFSLLPAGNFDPNQYPNGITAANIPIQLKDGTPVFLSDIYPVFEIKAEGYPHSERFTKEGVFFVRGGM